MIDMIDMIKQAAEQSIGGGAVLAFGLPGGQEWIILLVLGLLIFGRRLPEVGRSLGRGIVEFKKGIKGIEDDIETESSTPAKLDQKPAERIEQPTASASTDSPAAKSEEMATADAKKADA